MKTLFVDCETTGTDHTKHGLIQMAGALFVETQMVGQFNYMARPFESDVIEDEALEVNGRTREEIAIFPDPGVVYGEFVRLLGQHCNKYDRMDKIHMIGYNANFDSDFIREFFKKNDDEFFGSWFFWPVIDVANLAGLRLMQRRQALPNFRLMTVAKHLGISLDGDPHEALYDIKVTMRLFNLLTKDLALFEWAGKES